MESETQTVNKSQLSNSKDNSNIPLDQKLSALMLRGWTLLADVCSILECQCPLMRNSNKKVYCPNCEAWIFDEGIQCKMDFIELVTPKRKKILPKPKEVNETIEKLIKQRVPKNSNDNRIIQIHKAKLQSFTESLKEETDARKIKWLLKNINLCIRNIKALRELNPMIE